MSKQIEEVVDENETLTLMILGQRCKAIIERRFTNIVIARKKYDEDVVRELKYGLQALTKVYLKRRFKADPDKVRELYKQIWK